MKIGEFAMRYDMKPSAVRYYIDKAILTPERENGQYIFNAKCLNQMDKIKRYKDYDFTLDEILLLLSYESFSDYRNQDGIDKIITMIEDKKREIGDRINTLNSTLDELELEITKYHEIKEQIVSERKTYMPLEALSIFACPECGKPLKLENAEIESLGIVQGHLKCSCGYNASITDGTLICNRPLEDSPFKAFDTVDVVNALDYEFSPSYRTLIRKSHIKIYQDLSNMNLGGKILMTGPFSYAFALNFLKDLDGDPLIIAIDPSIKKINKLKDHFASSGKRIIFIAGNAGNIPLRNDTVNVYIDDFSFNNNTITYNTNLLEHISNYIVSGGLVLGHYVDYSRAPASLRSFCEYHPDFDPSLMSMNKTAGFFSAAGFSITAKENLGSPEGTKPHFRNFVEGESISLISYLATKK